MISTERVMGSLVDRTAPSLDRILLRIMSQVTGSTGEDEDERNDAAMFERAIAHYVDSGVGADPHAYHRWPRRHEPRHRVRASGGARIVETTFESRFVPMNPHYRDVYLSYAENRRIHLMEYRHGGARPVLLFVHGWAGGYPAVEHRLLSLNSVFDMGVDVVHFSLPFHGLRTPSQAWFGGQLFPSEQIERTNEAFVHAIHDLRVVMDYLRTGGQPIGLMGVSLGAYVSTLLTALGPEPDFLLLLIPLADLGVLLWNQPQFSANRARVEALGVDEATLKAIFAVHSPLTVPVSLDPGKVLIIASEQDGVCTRHQTDLLWRHLGGPRIAWVPGGHTTCFARSPLATCMTDFIAQNLQYKAWSVFPPPVSRPRMRPIMSLNAAWAGLR